MAKFDFTYRPRDSFAPVRIGSSSKDSFYYKDKFAVGDRAFICDNTDDAYLLYPAKITRITTTFVHVVDDDDKKQLFRRSDYRPKGSEKRGKERSRITLQKWDDRKAHAQTLYEREFLWTERVAFVSDRLAKLFPLQKNDIDALLDTDLLWDDVLTSVESCLNSNHLTLESVFGIVNECVSNRVSVGSARGSQYRYYGIKTPDGLSVIAVERWSKITVHSWFYANDHQFSDGQTMEQALAESGRIRLTYEIPHWEHTDDELMEMAQNRHVPLSLSYARTRRRRANGTFTQDHEARHRRRRRRTYA